MPVLTKLSSSDGLLCQLDTESTRLVKKKHVHLALPLLTNLTVSKFTILSSGPVWSTRTESGDICQCVKHKGEGCTGEACVVRCFFLAQSLGVHVTNLSLSLCFSCLNYRGSMQWTYGITHSPQIPCGTLHTPAPKPALSKFGTAAHTIGSVATVHSETHSQTGR